MKTGRVRRKEKPAPEEDRDQPSPRPQAKQPSVRPSRPKSSAPKAGTERESGKKPPILWLVGGALAVIVICFVIVMTLSGGTDEWVEATRVDGSWTTTVTLLGPQVTVKERWEAACIDDPDGTIRAGTCVMKDADTFQEVVREDYDEYAYNLYYEETWSKVYQAQGIEFVVTELGSDDWWEEDLHYTRVEELDRDSCQLTEYTLWVDDPGDSTQEIEVYLAECEVWDHVVVKERVYDQAPWCECDVTTLVEIGRETEQGSGPDVRWASPAVPQGGRTDRSFVGQVVFLGDDYEYTTRTEDVEEYQGYFIGRTYLGLKDGKVVTVSKDRPGE